MKGLLIASFLVLSLNLFAEGQKGVITKAAAGVDTASVLKQFVGNAQVTEQAVAQAAAKLNVAPALVKAFAGQVSGLNAAQAKAYDAQLSALSIQAKNDSQAVLNAATGVGPTDLLKCNINNWTVSSGVKGLQSTISSQSGMLEELKGNRLTLMKRAAALLASTALIVSQAHATEADVKAAQADVAARIEAIEKGTEDQTMKASTGTMAYLINQGLVRAAQDTDTVRSNNTAVIGTFNVVQGAKREFLRTPFSTAAFETVLNGEMLAEQKADHALLNRLDTGVATHLVQTEIDAQAKQCLLGTATNDPIPTNKVNKCHFAPGGCQL